MDHNRIFLFTVIFCLIILSSSCELSNYISTSTLPNTTAISSTNGLSMPLKSQTPTNMFLASSTNTILSTFTSLPSENLEPTLQSDAARVRLLELLSNNGNCRLPCFWGIYPGISRSEDAFQKLYPLSGLSNITLFDNTGGTIYLAYIQDGLIFRFHIDYETKDDEILLIHFYATVESEILIQYIYDSERFGKVIAYYSLSSVLDGYGRPSSILLKTQLSNINGNNEQIFDFLLLYPSQGIIITYTTKSHLSGTDIIACPEYSHIEVVLMPTENEEGFNEYLAKRKYDVLPLYRSLEDVTKYSIEEFYQLFIESPSQCLTTPAKLWPTIER